MATPIRMPQPGQMTEACTILRWYKREGDPVARGDPLFEIETDKSNMDVEAFDSGTLLGVRVAEGETVPVDTIVAWIGEAGEVVPAAIETEAAPLAPMPRAVPENPSLLPAASGRVRISPRAARRAAESGVDLRSIAGTGPGGRIVERDVEAAARAPTTEARPIVAPTGGGQVALDGGRPLSALRRVIARRLGESVATVPQFSVTVPVDMTGLVALRSEARATGSAITLTDIIHAATIQSLVEFPIVNARTDGRSVWMREGVDLGIAVSIPDGLLVPVIRGADRLELADLHDRTVSAIAGARSGRLAPDDLSGSTFTVSNMGMLEVEQFTAIVNPGESAILAVASVRAEPAAIGGGLAVRRVMRMTLTADHRLVDGEIAARFLNAIRRRLEDAESWRSALALV